eukprot:scaffold32109_cov21-Tisochrysis_lutea.AAC.1
MTDSPVAEAARTAAVAAVSQRHLALHLLLTHAASQGLGLLAQHACQHVDVTPAALTVAPFPWPIPTTAATGHCGNHPARPSLPECMGPGHMLHSTRRPPDWGLALAAGAGFRDNWDAI